VHCSSLVLVCMEEGCEGDGRGRTTFYSKRIGTVHGRGGNKKTRGVPPHGIRDEFGVASAVLYGCEAIVQSEAGERGPQLEPIHFFALFKD